MSMTDSQLARAVDMRDAALIDAMYEDDVLIEHQLEHFEEQVKLGNTCEFYYLTEQLSSDDNFWLAIGSGADYLKIRAEHIFNIVVKNKYYQKEDF
ncbi:hypothetical protein [Pasteurella multocida]|uniref:hypothetical protein n=1 Tax=Pasteurella multocida TaxID=747 RepID=UPI002877F635|nr:hypothetical protein [Pasteurella multocida]WND48705.1 hypothetical protein RHO06_02875 [Pasteurella multocida]